MLEGEIEAELSDEDYDCDLADEGTILMNKHTLLVEEKFDASRGKTVNSQKPDSMS